MSARNTWYSKGSPDFEAIMQVVDTIGLPQSFVSSNKRIDLDDKQRRLFKKYGMNIKKASVSDAILLVTRFMRKGRRFNDIVPDKLENKIGAGYPVQYLLFDFCLAAMQGDETDSLLYLDHCFNIFRMNLTFYRLLHLASTTLNKDPEMRGLLTATALSVAPLSTQAHAGKYGDGMATRLKIFSEELKKLKLTPQAA